MTITLHACVLRSLQCAGARGLAACVKGQYAELTLIEQCAQIDQVVRVEVGGAAGFAFDEIAQVARIGSRLNLEV